jgi:signal transduction histidine kinase
VGHLPDAPGNGTTTPARRLLQRGLLARVDALNVELPREIGLLLRGDRPYGPPRVRPEPPVTTREVAALDRQAAGAALESVGRVGELLAVLEEEPAGLLRSGGLGVRDQKRLARTLHVTEPEAGWLLELAFLAGLLDARLARTAVGDLVIELRSELAPAQLQTALARALRDPSLTLAYWLPDFRAYVDLGGRRVEVPSGDGRSTTPIDRNGERIAALVHDRALDDEPELLAAVGAAAGIALENGRLQAELAARLEEVRGSRARVLEAGQRERKRLERNLHDGAQQRLIALSLELGLLEQRLGDNPEAQTKIDAARREIALSLEELRDVARGLHPAVLTGHGLRVALESLAARAPVRVRLDLSVDGRLPEAVEVAAYYVVSESVTNVAKHAGADEARVSIARHDGGLVVEIVDDGVGGADTERGSGMRGLADRVEALGGHLRVWTPRGGGTRVVAEIPCA